MLSLNKRVLVSILVGFVLGVLVVSMYAIQSVKQVRRVAAHAQAAALVSGFDSSQDINQLPRAFNGEPISYTLYSRLGEMLSYSDDRTQPLKLKPYIVYSRSWLPEFETHGSRIGVPVTLDNGDILMVSQVDSTNRALIELVVSESFNVMLVALIHLILVFSLIVYWAVRWTLSPVNTAAKAANDISISNPEPIPLKRQPVEILPLIEAVNGAIHRLTQAYHAQQQFIADAAHELRTPLAVLKLRINHAKQKQAFDNLDDLDDLIAAKNDVQQLQNMTDKLLELARLEGANSHHEPEQESVHLPRVLREVIAERYPLYEANGRAINLDIQDEPFTALGSAHLLSLAFGNLIDNALHHGKGTLTITARFTPNQGIKLYFADQGISPDKAMQAMLFQRFKKAQVNSSGSGLGLAIVEQVVKTHGGSVTFGNTPNTQIEIWLPQD